MYVCTSEYTCSILIDLMKIFCEIDHHKINAHFCNWNYIYFFLSDKDVYTLNKWKRKGGRGVGWSCCRIIEILTCK